MGTFAPQNEIGNQIWARCCGRVARLEPHIASEKNAIKNQGFLADRSWGLGMILWSLVYGKDTLLQAVDLALNQHKAPQIKRLSY